MAKPLAVKHERPSSVALAPAAPMLKLCFLALAATPTRSVAALIAAGGGGSAVETPASAHNEDWRPPAEILRPRALATVLNAPLPPPAAPASQRAPAAVLVQPRFFAAALTHPLCAMQPSSSRWPARSYSASA